MIYIFSFRYKPDTELDTLNNFIKTNKLKWKARKVELNDDILVRFIYDGEFDLAYDFQKIRDSGVSIDSIEIDTGKNIKTVIHQNLLLV